MNEIVADITSSYEVAPDHRPTCSVQGIVDNFQTIRRSPTRPAAPERQIHDSHPAAPVRAPRPSFLFVRNLTLRIWNVMMAGGGLERGRSYCILRGETVSGETVDIRPMNLTNVLDSRTWTMVNATVDNRLSIHPENEELIRRFGGVEKLPPGVRFILPTQVWGNLYNEQHSGFLTTAPEGDTILDTDLGRVVSYADYENS